jgi:hypothetical protein
MPSALKMDEERDVPTAQGTQLLALLWITGSVAKMDDPRGHDEQAELAAPVEYWLGGQTAQTPLSKK